MPNNVEKSLQIAIVLTLAFFIVEVIGGLIAGSLSLLADAGHMFRDAFALCISLAAICIAKNLPAKEKICGCHRIEILAALANGIILLGVSGWIFWEAYQRFLAPQPIESITMFVVALIGLLVNIYIAFKLSGSHDLNIKSAFLHVLTDTFSSVVVIFASIWIFFTHQTLVDPIAGAVLGLFVLLSALVIIKQSVQFLMKRV